MILFDGLFTTNFLLFCLILYLLSQYNLFIKKLNQVFEDFSDIDIQLKRRADLIDKLVEIVQRYAKHEQAVFTKIAASRSALRNIQNVKDLEKAEGMYSSVYHNIIAVVENYPELKADKQYKELMDTLSATENQIAKYRETYNQSVKTYNTLIQLFPNLLVAQLFGFKKADYFEFSV